MRQHRAEMKLDGARQNLSRINDILIEIERQQNSLRRQAGKARRFRAPAGDARSDAVRSSSSTSGHQPVDNRAAG
jgi:chromosome segregation protein